MNDNLILVVGKLYEITHEACLRAVHPNDQMTRIFQPGALLTFLGETGNGLPVP